jgi:post-segregation antitoxin (ccd killing protein)
MSGADLNLNSSRKHAYFPRGKSHRKTVAKTTVGVYLPKTLVEKAKENKLNLSRILEEALSSILAFTEAQN